MSADTLAIIPARLHSEGIPQKNFTRLAGQSPVDRAIRAALEAKIPDIVISTDLPCADWPRHSPPISWQPRPAPLALGTTPMIEVVQYVLKENPGPDDQMIVLLQPTQPLRTAAHITQALTRLTEAGTDSVVSVVALPPTHHPFWQYRIAPVHEVDHLMRWSPRERGVTRRQALPTTYIRDGTVYAFWRRTVRAYRGLYGRFIRPLVIPPDETCPLDDMAQWHHAERLLRERETTRSRRARSDRSILRQ